MVKRFQNLMIFALLLTGLEGLILFVQAFGCIGHYYILTDLSKTIGLFLAVFGFVALCRRECVASCSGFQQHVFFEV